MRTDYDTLDQALDDGWRTHSLPGEDVRDTSGPNSFGYQFTLYRHNKPVARTHNVYIASAVNKMAHAGAVYQLFRDDEIST